MNLPANLWTSGSDVLAEGTKSTVVRSGADIDNLSATSEKRTVRLLVFTSLYPNALQPRHGVFVEERLRHLVDSGWINATVVAPVPWFPFQHRRLGAYAEYARVPEHEERYGISIDHPRYPVIPKLGMNVAPFLMYRTLLPVLRKLQASGTDFDLIDAHYFYPDGVAAALLGEAISKPVVITARGSDVTLIPHYRSPKRQIRWAAERVAAIVTVSQALKDKLATLGVDGGKITVLRNGVDLYHFRLRNRTATRSRLGLAGPVWLAVGNLIELKGVHVTLEALAKVTDVTLLVAGEGPEEAGLRQLADRLGVTGRVRFLGVIPHAELRDYYNAADALVLASSHEGMPNVVLESLACGTPVIVTPFDGATEVVGVPAAGQIAESRTADAISAAWTKLLRSPPAPGATRHYAEQFNWDAIVLSQQALYANVLRTRQCGARPGVVS